jgi:hypothetical protein
VKKMSQSSSSSTSVYFSSVLLPVAPLFYTSYDIFSYIVYGNLYVSVQAGLDDLDDLVTDLLSISRPSLPSNRLDRFIGALGTQFATPTQNLGFILLQQLFSLHQEYDN